MAILLKPRSNSQGVVDTTADLALLNGRPDYQVLVKDTGLFEWIATGVVDNDNIYPALNGRWSKVLMSGDITLPFTAEDTANKSLNVVTDAASDVKYPSVKAVKTYADSIAAGLLDDRGSFAPGGSSPGAWPTTGGSGTAGAIMKGDIWFCSGSGFMGTTAVTAGSSFRALVDTPGQTAANWNVLSAGAISTSVPSLSQVTAIGNTTTNDVEIQSNESLSRFLVNSTGGNGAAWIGYEDTWKGHLSLFNGSFSGLVRVNNLTATRTYQLPDANGTLALTSQIAEPYKVYTASFSLDSLGITNITVYRNTIGDGSADGVNDIAITRSSANTSFTMTGSVAFPVGKTWIQPANYISGGQAFNFYGARLSDTVVRYSSIRPSDNSSSSGFGPLIFIEIRVYP